MRELHSFVPNAEHLLSLEPEEFAGVILEMLNSAPDSYSFSKRLLGAERRVDGYPSKYQENLLRAIMEAWSWLEREGLVAPCPDNVELYFVTRRGKKLKGSAGLKAYRRADMLPRQILHPIIAEKVWSMFLRGEYDTAVFQAFKEVEVAVRSAGGFHDQDLGVALMRKAFNPTDGPLTDSGVVPGERQAISDLFAGAIGCYKNPHSHRNVSIDATEAVEMIMLASHLLKIVDSRSQTRS